MANPNQFVVDVIQPQKIWDLGFVVVFEGGGPPNNFSPLLTQNHRFEPRCSLNEEKCSYVIESFRHCSHVGVTEEKINNYPALWIILFSHASYLT